MRQELFNKHLLLLFIVGVFTFVLSCSSDDETKKKEVVDMNTIQDYDSISVDFRLMNADGLAVKTFKEGEQIRFYLAITNKMDKTLKIQIPVYVVGEDLFQVYSRSGPVDRPWDYSALTFALGHYWSAHKSYVYECSWQGQVFDRRSELAADIETPSSGITLLKERERQPLPVGCYYTEFKLTLNKENIITCHKDFYVVAK